MINMYEVYQTYYQSQLLFHKFSFEIVWIESLQEDLLFLVAFIASLIADINYFNSLIYLKTLFSVIDMMLISICTKYEQIFVTQDILIDVESELLYLSDANIISQYFKKRSAFAFDVAFLKSSINKSVSIHRSLKARFVERTLIFH